MKKKIVALYVDRLGECTYCVQKDLLFIAVCKSLKQNEAIVDMLNFPTSRSSN